MKIRKHVYIDETILERINESDKINLSVYITKLISEDLLNKEKGEKELDQQDKNNKYLLNHINTQNQILLHLLTNLMNKDMNPSLIPYYKSYIYQQAKDIVDDDKRKRKDKMRGRSDE